MSGTSSNQRFLFFRQVDSDTVSLYEQVGADLHLADGARMRRAKCHKHRQQAVAIEVR